MINSLIEFSFITIVVFVLVVIGLGFRELIRKSQRK